MQDDFEVLISQAEYKILMATKDKCQLAHQQVATAEQKLWQLQDDMDKQTDKLRQAANTIKDLSLKCIKLTRKVISDEERTQHQEQLFLNKERELLVKLMAHEREKAQIAKERQLEQMNSNKCERKIEELVGQVAEVQRQRDQTKAEVAQLERKNRQLEGQRRERETEVESMIVLNGRLTNEKTQMQKRINDMLIERDQKEAQIKDILVRKRQKQQIMAQMKVEMTRLTEEIAILKNENNDLKEESIRMKSQLIQKQQSMTKIKDEIDDRKARMEVMQVQYDNIQSRLREEKEERLKWYGLYEQSNKGRVLQEERLSALIVRVEAQRNNLQQLKKEQETLKQMIMAQIEEATTQVNSTFSQISQHLQNMVKINQILGFQLERSNNQIASLQQKLLHHQQQEIQRNLIKQKEQEAEKALMQSEAQLIPYVWLKIKSFLLTRMQTIPNDLDRAPIIREEFKHILRSLKQLFKGQLPSL